MIPGSKNKVPETTILFILVENLILSYLVQKITLQLI